MERRLLRLILALIAFVGLAATSCGDEVATDYTSAHRNAFLAACSSPLDDPRLLSDICVCVYDRLEDEISFSRFEAISESLVTVDGSEPPLPDEVVDAIADCFVSEADL